MLQKAKETISANVITRLLIVSYFIAIALGLIPGVEVSKMAEPFMGTLPATYLMRLIIFLLAGMVLFGLYRRPAALVLALVIFWNSYIGLYSGGDIGAFWRDLALIGGLLLTANVANYADKALAETFDTFDTFDDETAATSDKFSDVRTTPRDEGYREAFDVARTT